ncbi:hypothetical protein PspLS_00386 [Pyricularia sp. CBS 133598]|nr:hypothetical protein PspLS_00386 [Pyricularia sp. CBS 133598]
MQEPTIYRAPVGSADPGDQPTTSDEITGYQNMTVIDSAPEKSDDGYRDFVIPEDRKLGVFSTTLLIINRVVGTGIYSTPSAIITNTDNVGATLLFWVLGGMMTFALFVYLEFGTALPRSGGEKVYLERVYQKPRYLATCIFAVQFVLFAVSTGNTISFASYIFKAALGDTASIENGATSDVRTRSIAFGAITLVCLIHAFLPKTGIWLSNILGCFKLVLLLLVVCAGFAALNGHIANPDLRPDNFSTFQGQGTIMKAPDTKAAGSYAIALLQVLYAYSGWENANYVLTEVRDAPRTLKIAAPIAIASVTLLYVLANIAFFAAMSKQQIADSKVIVAAAFFENVWGEGTFTKRVVPVFIALSALGNVFAQSFAMPRVKQELAKEGILPFSRVFASDWPFKAPSGAIFLHWIFTVIFIFGSVTSDSYTFVTNVFIYTGNWIKLLIGVGLLYLTFKVSEGWREQRTTFRSYPLLTIFWIISLLYSVGAPFAPNRMINAVPFWVVPTLGTSMLAIGVAYWMVWANLMPLIGFQIQHEVIQLPDGSERVKYVRFFDSDVFNSNPFLSVSYLSRYADHVGIHYVLCNKLRQFPYEDIEFFLPQLCHLIISVDNESMALEEFLLDLCEESVTAALLVRFARYPSEEAAKRPPGYHHYPPPINWRRLQAHKPFGCSKHIYTTYRRIRRPKRSKRVQHIVFGLSDSARNEKIKENTLPVMVLGSFIMAAIGVPGLATWAGPLAVAQGRKPLPADPVSDPVTTLQSPTEQLKISRAHTINATTSRSKRSKDPGRITSAPDPKTVAAAATANSGTAAPAKPPRPPKSPRPTSSSGSRTPVNEPKRPSQLDMLAVEARLSSSSLPLPDMRSPRMQVVRPTSPVSAGLRPSEPMTRRHSHHAKVIISQDEMDSAQKTRLLRQNYFRCQTAFLTALEDISNRLVIVPKQARLSALRAELALITQDLPAEVDIPVICPPSMPNGSPGKSKHHRIVRVNPAESTVLNSAEKVPYLLMVEILRDDFSFDPDSADNQRLLSTLLAEQGSRKRIFDLTESPRISLARSGNPEPAASDSVFEPTAGDLGGSGVLGTFDDSSGSGEKTPSVAVPGSSSMQRLNSSATTISTLSEPTARSSATSTSRSSSPGPRRKPVVANNARAANAGPSTPAVEQPDFSALATHMRAASQMLAQLEATSGKRPKQEVAAIRAKIIASMQSLEEQSFDLDDGNGPTFDLIIAKADAANAAAEAAAAAATNGNADGGEDGEVDAPIDPPADTTNAGAARMENDFKTGGLQRKGDRDDPSAAVFGEAWHVKKERIRRSSPYGWMKNWDLVSVIVKTGADLRQEAFACQLINVCHRIWVNADVPVWVKLMRILVTGESSGLIETITNGVSLHSIKRSLTLSTIESGQNPRRRIATLKDHFVKVFGPVDSEPHKAGVDAFKRSLAAYSMISYILQLKDRHNGNVLVDNEGHIIHIDFGFMLSNSPGAVGFEAAPFKFTHEYLEVLGGIGSPEFEDFKKLCKQAFQALRREADNIIDLVSMMGRESKMPCFGAGIAQTSINLRQRFQLQLSADEAEQFVEDLIGKSLGSYYTRLEDRLGRRSPGEWTEFEVQLAISLICRKVHLEKPPKKRGERNVHFAKRFNAALNPSEANFHEDDLDESDVCDLLEWLLREKKGAIARVERLGVRRISRASLLAFSPSRNFTGTLVEWNIGGRRDAVMKRPRGERRRRFLPNPGENMKMRKSDDGESDEELSDGEIADFNPFYPEPAEKPNLPLDKNADGNESNAVTPNEGFNHNSTATSAYTELQPRDTAGYPLTVHTRVHTSHGQQQDHHLQAPLHNNHHEGNMAGVVRHTVESLEVSTNAIEHPQPQVVVCPTPAYHIDNRAIRSAAALNTVSAPENPQPTFYTFEGSQTGNQQAVTNNVSNGNNGVLSEASSAFTTPNHDTFLHNNLIGVDLEEAAYITTQPAPDPDSTTYYAAISPFASGLNGSFDSIPLQHNRLGMPAADDFLHASFDDLVVWDGDA